MWSAIAVLTFLRVTTLAFPTGSDKDEKQLLQFGELIEDLIIFYDKG
jgi:hypothetical protein